MKTFQEAEKIAEGKLREIEERSNIGLRIIKNEIIEFKMGWVFFYQSAKFLDTNDFSFMVGGNAPIIVNRFSGEITLAKTNRSIEAILNDYMNNNQA